MANFYSIYIVIKRGESIDVIPDFFRVCMKNMGTVMMLMAISFFDVASETITTYMCSLINYKTGVSSIG